MTLRERASRALYSTLMRALQPLLRLKIARRARLEPGYADSVAERFGRYDSVAPDADFIWLHVVSLGETRAAAPLVAGLRERFARMRLLVTSGTATGRAEAARLLRAGDVQVWQPWDTPDATLRFVRHFRPRIGILMETEIWPNLCAACERTGTPLVLANARLSEQSFRKSEPFTWLARPAYRSLAAVWAQSDADARRLARLGAPVAGVFGNLKFDARPDPAQLALGRSWRAAIGRPVVMFASSREGEEAQLLKILTQNVPPAHAGTATAAIDPRANLVQWLIVPRHPQRFEQVAQLIERHGLSVSRRSERAGQVPAAADVWLGDSLGEMALYYGMSSAALLGGSFEPLGGQNLIEAAACGCPIVMGPHTFNFADAAELARSAGAALQVDSLERAVGVALELVTSRAAQEAAAAAARALAARNSDATRRTVDAIETILAAHRKAAANGPQCKDRTPFDLGS